MIGRWATRSATDGVVKFSTPIHPASSSPGHRMATPG